MRTAFNHDKRIKKSVCRRRSFQTEHLCLAFLYLVYCQKFDRKLGKRNNRLLCKTFFLSLTGNWSQNATFHHLSDNDIRTEISESVYYCNSCAAPTS